MAYNKLKEKVKSFLQPFAESGQAVSAEDVKKYFEQLRGDQAGIQAAAQSAEADAKADNRKEGEGKIKDPMTHALSVAEYFSQATDDFMDAVCVQLTGSH